MTNILLPVITIAWLIELTVTIVEGVVFVGLVSFFVELFVEFCPLVLLLVLLLVLFLS